MKLGMVCTLLKKEHCGGKDEVAYNLLRGFAELGYDKDVVVFCAPEVADTIGAISRNFSVVKIRLFLPKYPTSRGKEMVAFFYRLFIKAANAVACQTIRRCVRKKGIDVLLFSNKETPAVQFPVKTAFITNDIQVFAYAGEAYVTDERNRKKLQERIINDCRYRDAIISISDFDREQVKRYLPQYYGKTIRIYNPIRFRYVTEKEENRQYITAINIQWPHKNTITLVKAFLKIADGIPCSLILVGRKPPQSYMDEMQALIGNSPYADRIIFTGYVAQSRLDDIISKTRIYVNPSLWEGFGMTAVEMMGDEVPTIVANVAAGPEVTLGLCRYYEPATSEKALADAILSELEQTPDRERLHEIALQVREKYNYVHVARQYWDELRRL